MREKCAAVLLCVCVFEVNSCKFVHSSRAMLIQRFWSSICFVNLAMRLNRDENRGFLYLCVFQTVLNAPESRSLQYNDCELKKMIRILSTMQPFVSTVI